MVKIDLITGFLGSGKTTFIRKYAQYLMDAGNNIGILENDYGAVNVDMMLLQDLMGENCELEMISGGCDKDCHRRRFKTKLIAMGMCGYDRVIVEPSGIFDVDAVEIANYIIETKATVRQAAKKFGISKSTVHKDCTDRLSQLNPGLACEVRQVLDVNKQERHIRGGLATREKYLHQH